MGCVTVGETPETGADRQPKGLPIEYDCFGNQNARPGHGVLRVLQAEPEFRGLSLVEPEMDEHL